MARTRAFLVLVAALAACGREGHPPFIGGAVAPGAVRFAVIGDYGVNDYNLGDHELNVSNLVKGWNPDFILTVGDNNYPSGESSTIDDNIGRYYSDYIGGYIGHYGKGSATNRFWPATGNHDWYSKQALQPYLDYFHVLPGKQRYYDLEIGLVHLFAVDSWHDQNDTTQPHDPDGVTVDSVQALWLKDRLAASTACFNLVYFHHPPYSSGIYFAPVMRWPFQAWGADVVVTGHEHFYERLEVDGIPYLINGLGGAGTFDFDARADLHSVARYTHDFGALFITATKADITFEFRNEESALIDRVTVPKRCR